jgi:hypothetical protein
MNVKNRRVTVGQEEFSSPIRQMKVVPKRKQNHINTENSTQEKEEKTKKMKIDDSSDNSSSSTDNIFRPVRIEKEVIVKKQTQVIIEDEPS